MIDSDDWQLVDHIIKGEQDLFAEVMHRTSRLVKLIVHRVILNEEDQKDLIQEIYLKYIKL